MNALTRTYPTAIAGTPQGFYFSTKDNGFTMDFTFDANVTAPTEIYADVKVRYAGLGWKFTASLADGTLVDGATFTQQGTENYFDFTVPDAAKAQAIDGQTVNILLTHDNYSDGVYIPQNGYVFKRNTGQNLDTKSGLCGFSVSVGKNIPKDVEIHVLDTEGNRALRFAKGDKAQSVPCSKLVDGRLLLVEMPDSFWDTTHAVYEEVLTGWNGVFTTIDITGKAKDANEVEQDNIEILQ